MKPVWFSVLILLAAIAPARADLTFPAVFEVVEKQPGEFHLTLTVPLVKGRYMKVKPIVPEGFVPNDEPEVRTGAASLTRSWKIEADRTSLYNTLFGLEGLQGTTADVRFLLTTMDGRRIETVLRPTRPLFQVPEPQNAGRLASRTGREGLRRAARSFGLWTVAACLLFSGYALRIRLGLLALVVLAFMAYWALSMEMPPAELSDRESGLMSVFHLAGCAAGAVSVCIFLSLFQSLAGTKVRANMQMVALVLTSAWGFYQGAGMLYYQGAYGWERVCRSALYLNHRWFSPFSADYALAVLRIPLCSLGTLFLLFAALRKIRRKSIRIPVSMGLFFLMFILLPFGVVRAAVPFMKPAAPTAKQAHRIIEPMLSGIYHALNLKDEADTYDRLAEQVSGELGTDLYLDSRRRLESGLRDGATVEVKEVRVERVEPQPGGAYRCRWSVVARVTHWQHTHERRNLYEGDLDLVVEEEAWKLAALNLRSEERSIVPGSFSSR